MRNIRIRNLLSANPSCAGHAGLESMLRAGALKNLFQQTARSLVELLIVPRTSAVAACCSSAWLSSREVAVCCSSASLSLLVSSAFFFLRLATEAAFSLAEVATLRRGSFALRRFGFWRLVRFIDT